MNHKILLVFCLSVIVPGGLFSQNDLQPCGTQDGIVPWLKSFQRNEIAYARSGDLLLAPVSIHIVGTNSGTGYFPVKSVLDAFCTLNQDFLESDIQFFIAGELHYINNSDYYDHTFAQGSQMMDENNVSNTINCYIVDSPAGNCGYSSYSQGIALAKNCLDPQDHTWSHEVGHTLSLPHPFVGWEGYEHDYSLPAPLNTNGNPVEKTDGSNCTSAGDGFCDTAPDYLNFRWPCNDDSLSTLVQIDPDGVEFRSDGTLFMSYAFDRCFDRFSEEQMEAMRANLLTERYYLLDQQDPQLPMDTAFLNALSPAEGDTVHLYTEVAFEWEPVPNATGYFLEIATFPDFPFTLFSYFVEGNSTVVYDLFRNKNYYWRISPLNNQQTCLDKVSGVSGFRTGKDEEVTASVETIEEIGSVAILPNPAHRGKKINVSFMAIEAIPLDASLISLTGQTVGRFNWQANVGQNQFSIEAANLDAGIYFLQMRSDKGRVSKKVVIGF